MIVNFYTYKISNRLTYTLNLVFKELLVVDYKIFNDIEAFKKSDGIKINYSDISIENSFQIIPAGLLHEKTIQQHTIETGKWDDLITLFHNNGAFIPFDIFSAIFYLVSRYEEYLPFEPDKRGHFQAKHSIAYLNDFLHKPVVNQWINKLAELVGIAINSKQFQFTPTIDVDNAYAFLHKGATRNLASFGKKILKGEFSKLKYQLQVLQQKLPDPFDTYEKLHELHTRYNLKPIYFFLVGDYGKYDTNNPVKNKNFQKLIQTIGERNEIGLHPSYKSNFSEDQLFKEKDYLEKILNKRITKCRKHFLMLSFPESYESLIKLGIEEDYSMGYSELPGFRANICTPFYFYNLKSEEATKLKIYPFEIMDSTFNYFLNNSVEKSLTEINNIVHEVKNVNGQLISLWHNESLSNFDVWKGWQHFYSEMLAGIYK